MTGPDNPRNSSYETLQFIEQRSAVYAYNSWHPTVTGHSFQEQQQLSTVPRSRPARGFSPVTVTPFSWNYCSFAYRSVQIPTPAPTPTPT